MTAPAPLFAIEDVEKQLGETFASVERTQVEWFITRATAEMRRVIPLIDDRVATGELDPVLVTGVGIDVVSGALDAVRRGRGVRSVQYPEFSTEYFKAAADELIALSPWQIDQLSPVVAEPGAFNLSLSGGE
ncbi:hypothetical protein [Tomitella gaofuii]|uniref:hypothetical protein n=1 Tax=Tomitella gaofuii TaxID=2760083 RepID=UPI0015FD97EC|nr:hypothetical protein [Tomitella gaofuii]